MINNIHTHICLYTYIYTCVCVLWAVLIFGNPNSNLFLLLSIILNGNTDQLFYLYCIGKQNNGHTLKYNTGQPHKNI